MAAHATSRTLRCTRVGARGAASRSFSTQPRVLVTGAGGQIGTELVSLMRSRYGKDNVIASDVKPWNEKLHPENGPFMYCDVTNYDSLARICVENGVDLIVHLASLLSAIGEQNPKLALTINVKGTENVLDIAKNSGCRVYIPSSIAAFGPTTPKDETPDITVQRPTTVYGITKVYTEHIGEYYHKRYGVDFRSLRYPGIISYLAPPGGGTTDYAIEIYHEALKNNKYTSFLKEDAALPMMYMADCLKATMDVIEADNDCLSQRVYNVTGMSFTPKELGETIAKLIPGFEIGYAPDFRQAIADSWPRSIDDSLARRDWEWSPDFDIEAMSVDMLRNLAHQYGKTFPPS